MSFDEHFYFIFREKVNRLTLAKNSVVLPRSKRSLNDDLWARTSMLLCKLAPESIRLAAHVPTLGLLTDAMCSTSLLSPTFDIMTMWKTVTLPLMHSKPNFALEARATIARTISNSCVSDCSIRCKTPSSNLLFVNTHLCLNHHANLSSDNPAQTTRLGDHRAVSSLQAHSTNSHL